MIYANKRPYGSVSALCRKHGISRTQFYHRLRDGWSEEEALGIKDRVCSWQTTDHAAVNRVLRSWKR